MESIRVFEKALRSNPSQAAAMINLGSAYLAAGKAEKAKFFLRSAMFKSSDAKISLLWLALLETQTGHSAEAHTYLDQLLNSVKLANVLEWISPAGGSSIYRDSILLPGRSPEISSALAHYLNNRLAGGTRRTVVEENRQLAGIEINHTHR
jgi:tetratricopeptide (TPR) repeat protein